MKSDLPYSGTFWSGCSRPYRAPLSQDIDADVAVIGGGFVGLSSAHALRQADPSLRVVVLEAEHCGFGASGRGSGMCVPLLHGIGSVARVFGWSEARWAARCIIDQAGALKDFVQSESIACEYRDSPFMLVAMDDSQGRWLRQRTDELAHCGYHVEVLSKERLRELVGYPATAGTSVCDKNFGQLQPNALAQGFAEAVVREGVQLFEHTRVERFDMGPNKVRLTTCQGREVTAEKLVLAPGAYVRKLGWGRFRPFPVAVHSYMLATEPLREQILGRLGSGVTSASVADASPSFFYLRTYRDRLLIGGAAVMLSKVDAAADRNIKQYRIVLAELHNRFPFLKETPIEAAWAGPIQSNLSELPTIRPLGRSSNVILNMAYVNGVPLSYVAGRLVVGLVLGSAYADPDVERLRRIFSGTRPSLGEMSRFGLAMIK